MKITVQQLPDGRRVFPLHEKLPKDIQPASAAGPTMRGRVLPGYTRCLIRNPRGRHHIQIVRDDHIKTVVVG